MRRPFSPPPHVSHPACRVRCSYLLLPAVLFLVISAIHVHVPAASTAAVFTAVALTLLCADRTVGARILAAGILAASAICGAVGGGIMVSDSPAR